MEFWPESSQSWHTGSAVVVLEEAYWEGSDAKSLSHRDEHVEFGVTSIALIIRRRRVRVIREGIADIPFISQEIQSRKDLLGQFKRKRTGSDLEKAKVAAFR